MTPDRAIHSWLDFIQKPKGQRPTVVQCWSLESGLRDRVRVRSVGGVGSGVAPTMIDSDLKFYSDGFKVVELCF